MSFFGGAERKELSPVLFVPMFLYDFISWEHPYYCYLPTTAKTGTVGTIFQYKFQLSIKIQWKCEVESSLDLKLCIRLTHRQAGYMESWRATMKIPVKTEITTGNIEYYE